VQKAFEYARENKNIGYILPALVTTDLYVLGKSILPGEFYPAITDSPKKGEKCITVSEDKSLLAFERWDVAKYDGRALLSIVPENCGVLFTYADGADYLSAEQVKLLQSVLDN
jgi:hypothetical protein